VRWRLLIPAMQILRLAPHDVQSLEKRNLVSMLIDAGFSIDREWQPNKGTVYIVARKGMEASDQVPGD
jgi:hypothetical protein